MKISLLLSQRLIKKAVSIPFGLLISSVLIVGSLPGAAQAQDASQTQNNQQQETANETTSKQSDSSSLQEITEQVNGLIRDVRGFVEQDVFGSFNQILKTALGSLKIPDLGDIVKDIMKANTLPNEGKIANQLENNLPNSYAIREDIANVAERTAAIGVAQGSALSKQAQEKSKQTLQASASAQEESGAMASNSEATDTSQQILRNISVQLKANAEIADLQMQEAQQARIDRALSLSMEAQAAKELSETNTRERQQSITERNGTALYSGLISMPGGAILDNNSTTESK